MLVDELLDGDVEAEGEIEADIDFDGLIELDGEIDLDPELDGLSLADGLRDDDAAFHSRCAELSETSIKFPITPATIAVIVNELDATIPAVTEVCATVPNP
jgi:hypothetical protein